MVWPFILIPFTQGCFVPNVVEIGPVVLEKKMKMWNIYYNNDDDDDSNDDDGHRTNFEQKRKKNRNNETQSRNNDIISRNCEIKKSYILYEI